VLALVFVVVTLVLIVGGCVQTARSVARDIQNLMRLGEPLKHSTPVGRFVLARARETVHTEA
jgi:hypothetical protein